MIDGMRRFYGPYTEYHVFKRDELKEKDWGELAIYAAVLSKLCSRQYDLEERPEPEEKDIAQSQEIKLKSFVGSYTFNSGNSLVIEYNRKNKINDYDFNSITREIAEWGAMFGTPFLKSLLRICSPITGEDEISLAYSDLLIRYTENALTEYIPPVIERRRYTTEVPLGRIHMPRTISLMAQGQTRFVTERAKANIFTLPVLFQIRFHSEMIKPLKHLQTRLESSDTLKQIQPSRAIFRSVNYHTNFVTERSRVKLFDLAYDVDFADTNVLNEVREQSSTAPSVLDMVNLWEAFLGRRALLSLIERILRAGYGLKPLCKLYELWCLRVILDVLSELFGEYVAPRRLPGEFTFKKRLKGVKAQVLYNRSPRRSMLVKGLKRKGLGVSAGKKPDFTVKFSGSLGKSITLVLDAKYRVPQNIGNEDLARFFWYLVDYGEFTEENKLEGLFFHVSSVPKIHETVWREKPEIIVHLLSMKPSNISRSKPELRKLFSHLMTRL